MDKIETLRKMLAEPGCIARDVPLAYDEDACVVLTAEGYVAAEGWRTITEAKLYVALRNNAAALLDAAEALETLLDWAEREGTHPQGAEVWFAVRDDARRALAALAGRGS